MHFLEEHSAHRCQERDDTENEDISSCHSQNLIQLAAFTYALHLDIGKIVERDVDAGKWQKDAVVGAYQRISDGHDNH